MLVLVVPAFALAGAGGLVSALLGGLLLCLPIALFFGAYPAALAELFDTETRGTGANVGYGVGSVVFATLPLIVEAVSEATDNRLAPAFCVAPVAVIGLAAALTLPRARLSREHHLVESDRPAVR
jgi:MHS family proline/betaine transporter-like MFS transporter